MFRYWDFDYLVRAALPKIDNAGGSEPCGKGTRQVCYGGYVKVDP